MFEQFSPMTLVNALRLRFQMKKKRIVSNAEGIRRLSVCVSVGVCVCYIYANGMRLTVTERIIAIHVQYCSLNRLYYIMLIFLLFISHFCVYIEFVLCFVR